MNAYSEIEYENQVMNDIIEYEMQRSKENAVRAISSIVHFEALNFTKVLSYAWFDSQQCAITLADKLNLGKLEFLAVNDEFDAFKEEFLKLKGEQ